MKKKGVFFSSFKDAGILLAKYWYITISIIIFQLIFFASFFYVQQQYQLDIMAKGQSIVLYYEQNLQTQANPAGEMHFTQIAKPTKNAYETYKEIISLLELLVISSLLVFGFLNGINWALTNQMINYKNPKEFFMYILKFAAISTIYIIPMILVFTGYVKSAVSDFLFGTTIKDLASLSGALVFPIFGYFMYISLSLLPNKFKYIFKKTFSIGLRNIGKMLLTYLVFIIFLAAIIWWLYETFYAGINPTIAGIVVLFFGIIYFRLFLMLVVKKLEKK